MASSNDNDLFKCHTCPKTFIIKNNRSRHEKKFGHFPTTRLPGKLVPIFNEDSQLYTCPSSVCETKSRYKPSVQRHINFGCSLYKKRRDARKNNKVCNFCGMDFTKKCNRDRHVRSKHIGDIDQPLLSFGEVNYDQPNESNPDFENSEDRDEMNLSLICSQTPIYEVTEGQAECEVLPLAPPGPVITVGVTVRDCSVTAPDANGSFANMLKEVSSKAEKQDAKFQKQFLSRIFSKIEANLKSNTDKNSAANFLYDATGDHLMRDSQYFNWLSKKLNYRPARLSFLLGKRNDEFKPRNVYNDATYQQIYNFWLNSEVAIPSVKSRNSRDIIRISKYNCLKDYKHMKGIVDENVGEVEVELRKTQTKTCYVSVLGMVHNNKSLK